MVAFTRMVRRLPFIALALAALVLTHELTYLAAHGPEYDAQMTGRGHDSYWTSFFVGVGLVALALAGTAVTQLQRLSRQTPPTRRRHRRLPAERVSVLVGLQLSLWPRLAFLTLALFLAQENLEAIAAGNPLPLLHALAGDHWAAIPILVVITFGVAFVAALVRWRRVVLAARLRMARRWPIPEAVRRSPDALLGLARFSPPRSHAVRAPPVGRLAA